MQVKYDGQYTWLIPRQLKNSQDIEGFEELFMKNIENATVSLGIDFSDLHYVSFEGLGRLIEIVNKAFLSQKQLLIVCDKKEVRQCFEKTGLTEYWNIMYKKTALQGS